MIARPPLSAALLSELQRAVSRPILTDEHAREPYARDFGGIFHCLPSVVVPVRSEEELCATLRLLRSQKIPATIRGGGYSCGGQALGSGVVIENLADNTIKPPALETSPQATIEVSGRTRWHSLAQYGKQHWVSPPVLTHYLGTSVGGTLSAGGYGAASIVGGAQVDHILRLRLVLPEGRAVWCSPQEDPHLFRGALAGLGRIGYIERVVLATIPYRPLVRLVTQRHANFRSLAQQVLWLADAPQAPDYFFAEYVNGAISSYCGYNLNAADIFSPMLSPNADQSTQTVPREFFSAPADATRERENVCHIWCDYFLEAGALSDFLTFLDEGMRNGRLPNKVANGLERIHLLCIQPPRIAGQRAFSLPGSGSVRCYGIGIFYSIPQSQTALIEAARTAQRQLLEECLRLKGLPICAAHTIWTKRLWVKSSARNFMNSKRCATNSTRTICSIPAYFPQPRQTMALFKNKLMIP